MGWACREAGAWWVRIVLKVWNAGNRGGNVVLSEAEQKVKAKMIPRQLEIIQHALGADKYGKRPQDSRNYFCAGVADEPDCRALVAMGYMQEMGKREWLPYYNVSVTGDGINAMLRESPAPPKLTRSQKRYQRFLDADSGYSFREWLKYDAAQRIEVSNAK